MNETKFSLLINSKFCFFTIINDKNVLSWQQVVLPRRYRSVVPTAQHVTESEEGAENLLTKECLCSYTSNWNLVHYKYSAYSGTYLELPRYTNLVSKPI